MSDKSYESPRGVWGDNCSLEAVSLPAYISAKIVLMAGILGGSLFVATIEGMNSFLGQSTAYKAAIVNGVAATFGVLIVADWWIHRRRPAFVSAVIGMLLASPFALVFAILLGLQAYAMGAKNVPGAGLVGLLALASFFLTLSLGGWVAICRTRSFAASENQVTDPKRQHTCAPDTNRLPRCILRAPRR